MFQMCLLPPSSGRPTTEPSEYEADNRRVSDMDDRPYSLYVSAVLSVTAQENKIDTVYEVSEVNKT
jgi:hypothetical protein